MRKQFTAFTAGLLLSTMLAGCSAYQGDVGNKNIRPNSIRQDANGNIIDKRFADDQKNEMNRINGRRLNSNNLVGSHKNYRMVMSEPIANSLTKIGPVKSAYVMLTDQNAYVAVSLDKQDSTHSIMSRSQTSYSTKEEARENRKKLSTLSTGQNMLTNQLENEIANEVRRQRPLIQHVYVSANPDFVGRMNAYMNDVQQGHSIQGYMAEFNAMAERTFPAQPGDRLIRSSSFNQKTQIYD
ncbi:Lipoprotein YhcN precursor [compost metagenome]